MSKVRKGTLSPMDSPEYHDEIGDLIDTYNYMTRKMDQLMTDQAKAAEELRIAEFRSLQAQINPHFLYNTMDMINWLAQQGRTDEVSRAVQSLSRFTDKQNTFPSTCRYRICVIMTALPLYPTFLMNSWNIRFQS